MAKCSACGKFLSPSGAATCMTCPCMYHKACVAIADGSKVPSGWACPECKKKMRKGDNSCTPLKGTCDSTPERDPSNEAPQSSLAIPPELACSAAVDSDVKEMRRELAEYMSELREFRKEFRLSMGNLGERVDGIEQRLLVVEQRELAVVARGTVEAVEVAELQQTVAHLKRELNERDQDALLADLDIGHLPEDKGENTGHVVTVLAAKLGITLEERDIVFAERVGASETGGSEARPRRVVVRLARRHVRDELLRVVRVRRNITSADVGLPGAPRRVYINERLTRANRQLFHRVREECRKLQWRYSWTKRGRIFARQADGKPVHLIRSDDDFDRVFKSNAV